MIEPTARPPSPDGGAERGRPVTGEVHATQPHQPAAAPARVRVRTPTDTPSAPAGGRAAAPEPLMFPQIARLELDELLGQLVERAQDVMATQSRLRGLLTATRAVASDLSLPVLLRQIVEAACELVGARYGAVSVLGGGGLAEFVTVGVDEATVAAIGRLPCGAGIVGLLVDDPRPLRLAELGTHARSAGFPAEHPPMTSFLGVPIRVRNRVYGNLYLTEKTGGGPFSSEDEELLSALAAAAGVAIDNARRYRAVQRRQQWLEASTEITRGLLTGEDPPLQLIARRARECAGADLATILLPAPGSSDTLLVTAADGDGDLRDSIVCSATSLARVMLREDRDPMVDAAAEDGLTYWTHNPPSGPALLVRFGGTSRQGVLALARGPGQHRFDAQEAQMAAGFAGHAGLAIELATAREVAQQATQRVQRSEDRGRIARDLHDHVIGGLFATGLGIQALAGRTADDADAARLGGFVDDLDQAIHTIRRSIFELRAGADAPRFRAAVLAAAHEAALRTGVRPSGPAGGAVGLGGRAAARRALGAAGRAPDGPRARRPRIPFGAGPLGAVPAVCMNKVPCVRLPASRLRQEAAHARARWLFQRARRRCRRGWSPPRAWPSACAAPAVSSTTAPLRWPAWSPPSCSPSRCSTSRSPRGTSGHLLGGALAAILVGPVHGRAVRGGGPPRTGVLLRRRRPDRAGRQHHAVWASSRYWSAWGCLPPVHPERAGQDSRGGGLVRRRTGLGAATAPIFTLLFWIGGTAPIEIGTVAAAMGGVHTLIGIGEGLITAVTVSTVLAIRPDLVYGARTSSRRWSCAERRATAVTRESPASGVPGGRRPVAARRPGCPSCPPVVGRWRAALAGFVSPYATARPTGWSGSPRTRASEREATDHSLGGPTAARRLRGRGRHPGTGLAG